MQAMRKYFLTLFVSAVMVCCLSIPALAQENNMDASTDANQEQSLSQTFEASEQKREYPGAVLPGFPGFGSYFSKTLMTHEYMGLADLAKVKCVWSDVNVRAWSNEGDREKVELRSRITASYFDPSEEVKLTFVNPRETEFARPSGIETSKRMVEPVLVGVLQANTTEKGVPMEAVFSVLAQEALENGANIMYPMNEGAARVLSASAWGASLGYTHVVIGGGSENAAGAGSLGIGYATGKTKYNHEPFARVAVYKMKDEEHYKNVPLFPRNGHKKAAEQLQQQNQQLRQQIKQMHQKIQQYQQEQEAR